MFRRFMQRMIRRKRKEPPKITIGIYVPNYFKDNPIRVTWPKDKKSGNP